MFLFYTYHPDSQLSADNQIISKGWLSRISSTAMSTWLLSHHAFFPFPMQSFFITQESGPIYDNKVHLELLRISYHQYPQYLARKHLLLLLCETRGQLVDLSSQPENPCWMVSPKFFASQEPTSYRRY